jgi:hypothetical protein
MFSSLLPWLDIPEGQTKPTVVSNTQQNDVLSGFIVSFGPYSTVFVHLFSMHASSYLPAHTVLDHNLT